MNIHNLETFIGVVKLKSIHKVAEAMFLSQPTVSARIKSLERELNTELFSRQGRRLLLTEDGREFIIYAEKILQTFKEGKEKIEKRDDEESVMIGVNSIASQYFLPFALPLWKKLNPQLNIKLVSASNDLLFEKVLQRKVDCAFINKIESNRVKKYQVGNNSIRLVAHPAHHLRDKEKILFSELAEEEFVINDYETSDGIYVRKLFEAEKIEPKIKFQVNHLEVAKSIIKNRYAIGFLPYMSVKKELENAQLIELEVEDYLQTEQQIHLTYLNFDVIKKPYLDLIKESVRQFNLE